MELNKSVPATKSWLCCTMLLFAVAAFWSAEPAQAQAGTGPSRETEPVVLTGSMFPDVSGDDINRMALYRWDDAGQTFQLVPFQIDEKMDKVFNPGTAFEITQTLYDVSNEEDGTLDSDDELVFLFQDAGMQAPPAADWPTGTTLIRHAIQVTNPDEVTDVRYVYLFNLTNWQVPSNYVSWDGYQNTNISSSSFELEYLDRWLLHGYRVKAPCGSGLDLIDRLKTRTGVIGNPLTETEEMWNDTAIWLGGKVGPVRAIRSVRGAASAINTFHHDLVYDNLWEREVTLRVHSLGLITYYLDWLPQAELTYYANDFTAGLTLDGVPNSGVPLNRADWELVRSPDGGLVMLSDSDPSPYVDTINRYHLDDEDFDDAPSGVYEDEDDMAIGNIGLQAVNFTGDETTPVVTRWRTYPLCSDTGDAVMGASYRELWDVPFTTSVAPQWRTLGPIRNMLNSDGPVEITLSWNPVNGADAYRVYVSDTVDLPRESWTLLIETTGLSITDPRDLVSRFYSVVPVSGNEEGDW